MKKYLIIRYNIRKCKICGAYIRVEKDYIEIKTKKLNFLGNIFCNRCYKWYNWAIKHRDILCESYYIETENYWIRKWGNKIWIYDKRTKRLIIYP